MAKRWQNEPIRKAKEQHRQSNGKTKQTPTAKLNEGNIKAKAKQRQGENKEEAKQRQHHEVRETAQDESRVQHETDILDHIGPCWGHLETIL